jgi:myo-inositol-1(or 4)-monophosphatase
MPATELSSADLTDILAYTVFIAREAGKLILEGSEAIQSSGEVDEKKNSVDLVTEYDVAVEKLVQKKLSEKYPAFNL